MCDYVVSVGSVARPCEPHQKSPQLRCLSVPYEKDGMILSFPIFNLQIEVLYRFNRSHVREVRRPARRRWERTPKIKGFAYNGTQNNLTDYLRLSL
uniref:Movement protein n=1 Tax=Panagrellus redivivus TaxID=6233 RepID=A0A7E4UPY6_PANRE